MTIKHVSRMKWDRIAKIRFEKILWKLSHLGGGGISMFTFLKIEIGLMPLSRGKNGQENVCRKQREIFKAL